MDILDGVELTEEQAESFVTQLSEWKSKVEENSEKKIEIFQEEVEQKSEEKYSALFESAQEKLQEVYANRLDEATKELYNVIKERTEKDIKSTEEYKLLEKVKNMVAPFIVESGVRESVIEAEKEKASLQLEIDRLQAERKLENLMKDLPENVQNEMKDIIGEIVNEEQVVEEFNKAVKLMKLTKEELEAETTDDDNVDGSADEGIDPNPDPKKQIDPSGETPEGKSPVKSEGVEDEISDEMIENILNEAEGEDGDIITEGDQNVNNQPAFSPEVARMRKLANVK